VYRHAGAYDQDAFFTQALHGLAQAVMLGRILVAEERDLDDRDI
jgi:hypothetical protein